MTLERAIKLLTDLSLKLWLRPFPNFIKAIQLGIKAIKREQISRREIPYDRDGLLPGETEE